MEALKADAVSLMLPTFISSDGHVASTLTARQAVCSLLLNRGGSGLAVEQVIYWPQGLWFDP